MNFESTPKLHFKSIIISDLHLGSPYCQIEKIIDFLHHTSSDTLVLNGDFIDGWSLMRKGGWKNRHTRCIRIILKKMREEGTRIIYVRGNHDDFMDKLMPISFEDVELRPEFIYATKDGDYLVTHGDGFDSVTSKYKWLAVAGDIGYQLMMKLNAAYQEHHSHLSLPAFSISRWIKAKVKSVVSFVDGYEQQLQNLANERGCKGIICGHIHTPADRNVEGVHYLNSGDWVESNTAIVEHFEGGFELLDYEQFQSLKSQMFEQIESDSSSLLEERKFTSQA